MMVFYLFCAVSLLVQAAALWQLIAIRRELPRAPVSEPAPAAARESENGGAAAKKQAELEAGIGAILAYGLEEMTRRPGDAQ